MFASFRVGSKGGCGMGKKHIVVDQFITGRFVNEKRHERLCTLCNSNLVEDTEHFLFHCSLYKSHRVELDDKARTKINGWDNLSCIDKLSTLFEHLTRMFAKYVRTIFTLR